MVLHLLKMDDILDACFVEDLFTTPLRQSRRKKEKHIESRNLWKYVDVLTPRYETHKVTKEEIISLSCRVNYEVSPMDKNVNENDMLYHLFAEQCGQDKKFMRTWLHLFVRLHKKFFNNMAKSYLARKGQTLDYSLDSVQEGRKGDVLTLLGLCMLIEKHALVHLHRGSIWTSLKDYQDSHYESLSKSDIHLIYLGRGNFARLTTCPTPLSVVDETASSQTVLIGTLFPFTPSESKALDTLIKTGLGVAIARDESKLPILVHLLQP